MYKIEKKNNNKSFNIIATILSTTLSFSIFRHFNKIKKVKILTSHILNGILTNIENEKYNIRR